MPRRLRGEPGKSAVSFLKGSAGGLAVASRLVGRPVDDLESERFPGSGPAFPVHRRPSLAPIGRFGAAAPGGVPGGGRRTRALVAETGGRPGSGRFGSRNTAGLVGTLGC